MARDLPEPRSVPPPTASGLASQQARAAWDRGRAHLAEGALTQAAFWFGRACRLAPSDDTPKLSLAGVLLGRDQPERAAPLFREVAARADVALAWIGLASALLRAGDPAGAAAALVSLLSRHVVDAAAQGGLFDAVVAASGHTGWCGVDHAGRLVGRSSRPVRWHLDGVAVGTRFGAMAPTAGTVLRVIAGRQDLLGSPLQLARIRRLEGVVRVEAGGIAGWAWHPGDPQRDPALILRAGGITRAVPATDLEVESPRPFAQIRGFAVPASALVDLPEPIAVLGPDGTPLAGSPVSPRALAAAIATKVAPAPARRARAPSCPQRQVAVVVPVYRGMTETLACLRDVQSTAPWAVLLVVDDATPETALAEALEDLARAGSIRLLRNTANLGFPASVNTGIRAALALDPPHDVVVLNSDTRLPPLWLDRLRDAVQTSADIGTATPLSNDAAIASYPRAEGANPPPSGRDLARLADRAARANPDTVIDVPTGVGFCLYLRRECLRQTGLLREDVFAQGYGEENDLCLRATRLGWRHVVVPGAYVAHVGGRSFGAARAALMTRNLAVLERLHPGYAALIERWSADDPLAVPRRRLDLLRWAARPVPQQGAVLLVTHDHGGGVERCVRDRIAALTASGHRTVLLRPVPDRHGATAERRTRPGYVRIDDADCPNLVFRLPEERGDLLAALRATSPVLMEVHHRLGHPPCVLDLAGDLGIPYDLRLHDYATFCPRITLTSARDRYCGEPDVAGCVACVATHGSLLEEAIGPRALRARSAAEFDAARQVVAPSADMAARMRRHFPGLRVTVIPHEAVSVVPPVRARVTEAVCRVLLIGGIGGAKGFEVLLACARDAAARALPMRFVVVGHTSDDDALFDTGRVDITGPYPEGEVQDLIAEQSASVGFVPSLCPETWCFALSAILAAGLPVVAFDIGAQAARIRQSGGGTLLPLGSPAATINHILRAHSALLPTRLQFART